MSMLPDSLKEYLEMQPEYIRDVVLEQYMRSKLIKGALENPIGKTILNEVITAIRDKMLIILKAAWAKPDDKAIIIQRASEEISLLNEILQRWAKLIELGESHALKAGKIRK